MGGQVGSGLDVIFIHHSTPFDKHFLHGSYVGQFKVDVEVQIS